MAREVRSFAVLVPAGTTQANPLVSSLAMPARIVRRVRVRVPPGPLGTMGWALGSSGVRVIPWGDQQYMVMNDELVSWDLVDQIETGAWQLQAYNVGHYPHTVYVTFELDPPGVGGSTEPLTPLELTA